MAPLPYDLEAEQAVLGAFLIDDDTWSRIGDSFSPEPFYLHAHQAIAAAIIGRRAKGEPPDPILLRGDLVDAGDHAAADLVFPLAGSLRTAGNVSYYWQRLLELFEARRRPSRGNRHALHRRRPREGRSGSGRWAEADRHGLATAGPRPLRRLRDSVTQHPRRPTQERKEHLGADRCRAPRRGRRLRTTSTSKTAAAGSRGATVPAAFASNPCGSPPRRPGRCAKGSRRCRPRLPAAHCGFGGRVRAVRRTRARGRRSRRGGGITTRSGRTARWTIGPRWSSLEVRLDWH